MKRLTKETRDFLNGVHFAVVATLRPDGLPHQTVMWYALQEDGTLLLNTPFDSVKHRHLKRDPRLSVCVEDGYRYVTLRGAVEINEDPEQAGNEYMLLGQRYQDTFAFTQRPAQGGGQRPAILGRPRVSLYLTVDSVTGNGF